MANPNQKTILIDNAYEELENICINLQKNNNASNLEVKSLLKLILNEWKKSKDKKLVSDSDKVTHYLKVPLALKHFNKNRFFTWKI